MSIIKLGPHNFENYELVARPLKSFRSSSLGVTGSVLLMPDASTSLKDISRNQPGKFSEVNQYDDEKSENLVEIHKLAEGGNTSAAENLFKYVNSASQGLRYTKRQEVLRTEPGTTFNKNFFKKNVVRNNLFPFYRNMFPSLEWAYSNYNTLNFYEDNKVPSNTALVYPAGTSSADTVNFYAPSSSFTFDFYLKPRTNSDSIESQAQISPGTILHMSSCYAISLVTGSSKDIKGLPDKYRILLQLSSSANIKPENCKLIDSSSIGTSPISTNEFIFASTDNSVVRDQWNHISIRWPGGQNNGGTGSFVINGVEDASFAVTASTIMQTTSSVPGIDDPNALFVGNYFYGTNQGSQAVSLFFNNTNTLKHGVNNMVDSETSHEGSVFTNPLRGELHDIKIFNKWKTLAEIDTHKRLGISSLEKDLLLFIPPFFVKETRNRKVLRTPFVEDQGKTSDPFNINLSFGLGALDVNLENFTREFVQKSSPLLLNLTASVNNSSVFREGLTANDVIYRDPSARKRLRTILPCDNGMFKPDYSILASGSSDISKFVDSDGNKRMDLIDLSQMVTQSMLSEGIRVHGLVSQNANGELIPTWTSLKDIKANENSLLSDILGSSPEKPTTAPGANLTVFQRTGDPSSSEVVLFDISNMFYGDEISPGSLVLEDLLPTGSNGSLAFKLKDNGQGNLYRSDINDGQIAASWSSVGNILYDEGLVIVKSPNLGFFGKEDFRLTFKGKKSIYVFEVTVPVEASLHNSSSNPTYKHLKPTDYTNEIAERFNYITGIKLHDDNLNIVGKAALSQPFMKRENDRIVIKLRMDF